MRYTTKKLNMPPLYAWTPDGFFPLPALYLLATGDTDDGVTICYMFSNKHSGQKFKVTLYLPMDIAMPGVYQFEVKQLD